MTDDKGHPLAEGDLMEGCCADCAGEPAFWHECDDERGQFCDECTAECKRVGTL